MAEFVLKPLGAGSRLHVAFNHLLALLVTFFIVPTAFDGLLVNIMKEFSVFERFGDIFTGVFELSHVVFFLSVIVFFLFLTYQEVEKKRWS